MIKISSAESQIMEALWTRGALTPDEVVAEVGPANGWARNTVRVMITRLLNKGAISSAKEEDGRFLYRPVLAGAAVMAPARQVVIVRSMAPAFATASGVHPALLAAPPETPMSLDPLVLLVGLWFAGALGAALIMVHLQQRFMSRARGS